MSETIDRAAIIEVVARTLAEVRMEQIDALKMLDESERSRYEDRGERERVRHADAMVGTTALIAIRLGIKADVDDAAAVLVEEWS